MTSNRLKLNADKTEFIWLGTRQRLTKTSVTPLQVGGQLKTPLNRVPDLGGIISELTMYAHVKNVLSAAVCTVDLRQLRSIRRSLSTDARRTLAAAFIASQVDYCNAVLYSVCSTVTRCLQMVLNAASRLVVDAGKF